MPTGVVLSETILYFNALLLTIAVNYSFPCWLLYTVNDQISCISVLPLNTEHLDLKHMIRLWNSEIHTSLDTNVAARAIFVLANLHIISLVHRIKSCTHLYMLSFIGAREWTIAKREDLCVMICFVDSYLSSLLTVWWMNFFEIK